MCDRGTLNMTDPLQRECLWFCFARVLQTGLDEVRDSWNTHYIRKSRYETVAGRPDSLYTIPEFHGGIGGLIVPVQNTALDYAHTHLVDHTFVPSHKKQQFTSEYSLQIWRPKCCSCDTFLKSGVFTNCLGLINGFATQILCIVLKSNIFFESA